MNKDQDRICPVGISGCLDNMVRRVVQNPLKILSPYVKEGMTALDVGCGPGFFTIPMAHLVGSTGRVIAVDLQEGMLDKIRRKITGTEIEKRIVLHKCDKMGIGISGRVDFVLLFYVVHELSDKDNFFGEIARMMWPSAQVLFVEPPFHVSKSAFDVSLEKAETAGLMRYQGPKLFLSRTAILRISQQQRTADAEKPGAADFGR